MLVGCSIQGTTVGPPAVVPAPVASPSASPSPADSPGWRRFQGVLELSVSASSEYPGWSAARLLDQDPTTSWFSDSGDSVARGLRPWVQVSLSHPARVSRVIVVGNREPSYPEGYSVLAGVLRVLGQEGELLRIEARSPDPPHDFVFTLERPLSGVVGVHFEVTADEGTLNSYGDVAIGEIRLETEEERE